MDGKRPPRRWNTSANEIHPTPLVRACRDQGWLQLSAGLVRQVDVDTVCRVDSGFWQILDFNNMSLTKVELYWNHRCHSLTCNLLFLLRLMDKPFELCDIVHCLYVFMLTWLSNSQHLMNLPCEEDRLSRIDGWLKLMRHTSCLQMFCGCAALAW